MADSDAQQLMSVLITKMENMDSDLALLKQENERLRATINNPKMLLRKMGLVSTSTPLSMDLGFDPLRADMENDSILKGDPVSSVPQTNEEFHIMSWDEIHEMAATAKEQEMKQ
tara:strand:+ start:766 stop:1107 length:342 start_codon:yes stop_codon:yes gene_type:complete